MRFIYSILIFLFSCANLYAQKNIAFEKANFKSDVSGLKEALRNIQEGDFKYNTYLYGEA